MREHGLQANHATHRRRLPRFPARKECLDSARVERVSFGATCDWSEDAPRKRGIISIGVFEQTLVDANANGDLYYTSGSGVFMDPVLCKVPEPKPDATYIYAPKDEVRKRVYHQLKLALGKGKIKFIGRDILEVDEEESELRELGLGISEIQKSFLTQSPDVPIVH